MQGTHLPQPPLDYEPPRQRRKLSMTLKVLLGILIVILLWLAVGFAWYLLGSFGT
jgi:hypothetical protein